MNKKPNIKLRVTAPQQNQPEPQATPPLPHLDPLKLREYYRPLKRQISIRIDADVLDWFQSQSGKYQTLINKALRTYMQSKTEPVS